MTDPKLAPDAVTEPKNAPEAVTEGKIGPQAVTEEKISPDAVGTGKIADNAVTTGKIGTGQVRATDLGGINVRDGSEVVPNNTGSGLVQASCNAGEKLTAAEASGRGPTLGGGDRVLKSSFPVGNSWVVTGFQNSGGNLTLTAFALCLQA